MEGDEVVKAAMAVLRSRRSRQSILAAASLGGQARKGKTLSEEHKESLRKAQQDRRDRERELGIVSAKPDSDAPKRPRGRPRKVEQESVSGND